MIRCIAIDDEPVALTIISHFCQRKGGIELSIFTDPNLGLKKIIEQKPELVFLDINMNDVSGLDIAKCLPRECHLVFTTAFANYALDGFELNAVDFLHKPFSFQRFERAVDKVCTIVEAKSLKEEVQANDNKIVLKVEYQNVTISTSEISYIEAMDNYVRIHRTSGRSIVSQISMKGIMCLLPDGDFVRIHKSYIIARDKVFSYNRRTVKLIDNCIELPIGRAFVGKIVDLPQP